MSEKKVNKFRLFAEMMKIGMLLTLIVVGMQVGVLWTEFKEDNADGSIFGFVTYQKSETISVVGETHSDEFIASISRYNQITRTVWISLFFYIMFEMFSFLSNKKEHWLTIISKKLDVNKWKKLSE